MQIGHRSNKYTKYTSERQRYARLPRLPMHLLRPPCRGRYGRAENRDARECHYLEARGETFPVQEDPRVLIGMREAVSAAGGSRRRVV